MTVKLGRIKPQRNPLENPRLLQYRSYATAWPAAPASIDWTGGIAVANWGMADNDTLGDCTIATVKHQVMGWTACASGTPVVIPDSVVKQVYSVLSPHDQGCVVTDVLDYWQATGIAGNTLSGYLAVSPENQPQIKQCVDIFGSCYIGVTLTQGDMTAFDNGQPWTRTGGWPIGGHAIPIVKYDANYAYIVTWGKLQAITWAWFEARCDEAYACVDEDWISVKGMSPSGFNLTQLLSDIGAAPPPVPVPPVTPPLPPPSPTPTPTPVPPAPTAGQITIDFPSNTISAPQPWKLLVTGSAQP